MLGVEGLGDPRRVELVDRKRQLVPLARRSGDRARPAPRCRSALDLLAGEDLPPLLLHLGEELRDAAHVGRVERRLVGADEVVLEVRHQHPGGAEDRGLARDEQHRDLELGRDRGRVHRPRTAGDDEREVARVEAAADADLADAGRHRDVDDVVDPGRRLDDAEAERAGEPALDRLLGRRAVEAHLAAEERGLVDEAEHEVGVGDGRLGAAAAVAGRARARRPRSAGRRAAGRRRRRARSSRRRRRSCGCRPSAARAASGRRSRRSSRAARRPSRARASKLVPPMSIVEAVALAVRREVPEPGGRARGRARRAARAPHARRPRPASRRRRSTA